MKRRELFRRTLLGAVGTAVGSALPAKAAEHHPATREFPPDYDASRDLERSDWKPVFLNDHQNETLIVLSDLIIPGTDTPGAKDALVNRFIDRLLAAETRETQKEFLNSLAFIDGECRKRHGGAFVHLPRGIQVEFLTFVAHPHSHVTWGGNRSDFPGYAHFSQLKSWIARAYYNSEIGMMDLGWSGSPFGQFQGCPHPEGSHK